MAVTLRAAATGLFRFVLVGLLAVVLLASTTLLITFAVAWFQDGDWSRPQYLTLGLLCGLVSWLFVLAFYLRPETGKLPFTQRDQFVAKAKSVLHEMGYALSAHQNGTLTFRPRFHSYLFGGNIYIALEGQEAKVTGPKVSLEIFRRGLRLMNHVQRVQIYLQDHTSKVTETVLKCVELRLRLDAEQLEAVRRHVIELLEKTAAVECELSLLVNSEKGIREDLLETDIRPWLDQQGIGCEIRKNLVQFIEVAQSELETVTVTD